MPTGKRRKRTPSPKSDDDKGSNQTNIYKKNQMWTRAETDLLLQTVRDFGQNWDYIQIFFPDRNIQSLQRRYKALTTKKQSSKETDSDTISDSSSDSISDSEYNSGSSSDSEWVQDSDSDVSSDSEHHVKKNQGLLIKNRQFMKQKPIPQKWTEEENELLLNKVGEFGQNWEHIQIFFPDRSIQSLQRRYKALTTKEQHSKETDSNFGGNFPSLGKRTRTETQRTEPNFSKTKSERVPTLYGIMWNRKNGNGYRQGPHTIPFALTESFIMNNTYETIKNAIPTPKEFLDCCEKEEIDIIDDLEDTYQSLYARMKVAQKKNIEWRSSGEVYPHNIPKMGWRDAAKHMVNMHPHATYHWRNPIDEHTKDGKEMLAGKGTEGTAKRAYENGGLNEKIFDDAVDGLSEEQNEYKNQQDFKAYREKWKNIMIKTQKNKK